MIKLSSCHTMLGVEKTKTSKQTVFIVHVFNNFPVETYMLYLQF